MTTHIPASPIQRAPLDVQAITTHLATLADTQPCPDCGTAVLSVLADITGLVAILAQLCDQLAAVRLDNANLRAAIRAALGAAGDGESDPLDYLRWELPERDGASPDAGRGRR
jgi:hypothetical protein